MPARDERGEVANGETRVPLLDAVEVGALLAIPAVGLAGIARSAAGIAALGGADLLLGLVF